ncbi:HEAT repeat domain-containing protein [Reichenbachiella agarivorans]|uniref:HEAT repeat domain-containing protein n=1 Tax=Reichenbachiella agarivorans TaxID=2979464 RepID=A0ABY6CNA9_9BACT|nr:HEAT repeat domain-containing protein [Reichenbachiella agarivorans]UXP32004.1 HEAT repeat domain-containing protein [Reichenbachiella agarivorans]
MGVFLATYQVGAETLFIGTLGEAYLDVAFFLAGALGIFTTALYVYIQKRSNFSTLVVSNAFLIFLFISLLRLAFWYTDYDQLDEGFQILPFILFVMIGPVTAITLLGFWGIFGRIFDLKQAKRTIGGIDTGQLTATMIAFFSIPLLTSLDIIDNTYDLLFFSAFSALGILIVTIWIVKDYNLDATTKTRKDEKVTVRQITYRDLFKDKYMRMLCLFMVFSMSSAVFANYVYISATEIMYPVDPNPEKGDEELRNFLSFANAAVMVLSFIIQSFINDIIIGRFGLRVSLMVMPLVLGLFTIGAIFSGHMFGYEEKTDEFLFFFIFLVVGKVFTSSLKDALENPAFKLFFLPFDVKIRFDIQSRIEGVVNQTAILIAGGLQIVMGLFVFFELIHYAYFILLLAGFIIYYAGKLYTEYKSQLLLTLEDQKVKLHGAGTKNEYNTINILKKELLRRDEGRAQNALKLMEKMEPILLDFSLLDFIRSQHKSLRQYAYYRLGYLMSFNTLDILEREIKKEEDPEVRLVAANTIEVLQELEDYQLTEAGIKKLVRSTETKDRIFAARVLVKLEDDKFVPFLTELLRDINPSVRRAAITTAGKLKRPEFWNVLIENLHIPAYSNYADSALIASGETVFYAIDSAFYKTAQHTDTMVRIIQIMGKIGGKTASEMLWKKIDFPDKAIVSEMLLSLSYIGFSAKDFYAARIKIAIESTISDLAWNIKAVQEIPRTDFFDRLIFAAFEEENKKNFDLIFMLLSMIYDAQSIKLVRDNIDLGTTDSVSFGIEMLDIFVDENIKPKLSAVLDDVTPEEKLKRLNNYFPPENFEDYSDLLLQIVNRDYNNINKYTKCLAIYKLSLIRGQKVTDDLIANLFNPDYVMVQTAAATMYKLDADAYQYHTKRLKTTLKKRLDKDIVPPVFKINQEDVHQKLLVIERVIMLKQIEIFKGIPGVILLELCKRFEEIKVGANTTIAEIGDYGTAPVYIVLKGSLRVDYEDGTSKILEEKGIVGHKLILMSDVYPYNLTTETECLLLTIGKDELYDAVSRNVEMVDGILTIVNESEIEEEVESLFN